jgi:hypothetical protein
MCEPREDDEDELLEAPLRSMSCSDRSWDSSTLLATKVPKEMGAFLSLYLV